jgi:hypothetical protein
MSYYIYFIRLVIYKKTWKLHTLPPAKPRAYWFVRISKFFKTLLRKNAILLENITGLIVFWLYTKFTKYLALNMTAQSLALISWSLLLGRRNDSNDSI